METNNKVYIVLSTMLVATTILGAQLAYADNEGSYQYGYQGGKSEWDSCAHTDGEGDCTAAFDYCAHPSTWANGTVAYWPDPQVTNIAACTDGYVQAWDHSCDPIIAKKADTMSCPLNEYDRSPP
jgi:hypothetical protein